MQSQIKEAKESVEDGTLTMDIVAEGNKLVYVYTYQTDLDIEATKEALATAIEQQASVFENVAKEIKNAVNVENPIVEGQISGKKTVQRFILRNLPRRNKNMILLKSPAAIPLDSFLYDKNLQ